MSVLHGPPPTPDSLAASSSSPYAPLGDLRISAATDTGTFANVGAMIYLSVKNNSGSTIAAYMAVKRTSGVATALVSVAAVSDPVELLCGITLYSIADGAYGLVVRQGLAVCTAGTGGFSAGDALKMSTTGGETGKLITAAVGAPAFGHAAATVTAGNTGNCYVNCRG